MPCAGFPRVAWSGSRRPDFQASHWQIHWQLAGLRSDVPGTNSLLSPVNGYRVRPRTVTYCLAFHAISAVLFGDGSAMRAQCSCTDQVVLARQFGPTVDVDHTRR